jgi:hypothetical protein
MTTLHRAVHASAAALLLATAGCAGSGGGLGNILGSVLGQGAGSGNQLAGTVRGVDTRAQQLGIQQSNGQTVAIGYDNQTKVVYQNKLYNVTSLEAGDQVLARVQSASNGAYYTDSVEVTQPVNGSATNGSTTTNANVQTLQGTVRQVDQANGLFTMDTNNGRLTVALPYNPRRSDVTTFTNLRAGDAVRLYGVFLNNSRVELRQFY